MRIHSLVVATTTSTPSPTPSAPALTAAQAAGFNLGLFVLIASVLVVVLALGFALLYHEKLLRVIRMAVRAGQPVATAVKPVVEQSPAEGVNGDEVPTPRIIGPRTGAPEAELVFAIKDAQAEDTVEWAAEGGTPPTAPPTTATDELKPCFVVSFNKAGTYVVVATVARQDGATTHRIEYIVSVGASGSEKSGAAPGAAAITLPFVISNWGRLVIVIFGVGVVGALMASAVIAEATGIGILGTLLGVGAAAAMSPSSDVKPGAKEPETPETPKTGPERDE